MRYFQKFPWLLPKKCSLRALNWLYSLKFAFRDFKNVCNRFYDPKLTCNYEGFSWKPFIWSAETRKVKKSWFFKKVHEIVRFLSVKKNVSILHLKFFGASGGYHDTDKDFQCLRRATILHQKFAHYFNVSILYSPRRNATGQEIHELLMI